MKQVNMKQGDYLSTVMQRCSLLRRQAQQQDYTEMTGE